MKTLVFLSIFIHLNSFSQKIKAYYLSSELREISGLESLNDTLFIAVNDGGNEPLLYLINQKGKILKTCRINNATNIDWEDLTSDHEGNLYIADIGNNSNRRTKMQILRVKVDSILQADSVRSAIYSFSYPNQEESQANIRELNFDAESLSFYNDSLWIFTKNRSIPFDGKSTVYAIHSKDLNLGNWCKKGEIVPGIKSWKYDTFTSSTIYKDTFYLITYNKLVIAKRKSNSFEIVNKKRFLKFNQRESIAISPSGKIFIANEGHFLLGKQSLISYINE
ncbi:MAG: hypothetical protein ACKO6A_03800 [Bacteroidota bacterium]